MWRALGLWGVFSLAVYTAQAQEITVETLEDDEDAVFITESDSDVFLRGAALFNEVTEAVRAVSGIGAELRALDKLTGEVRDISLAHGEVAEFGYLRVGLTECRHPDDNIAGEAYAYLTIGEESKPSEPVFQGWMIASSPALNAMDHARFDVWVMRCQVDSTAATSGNE